MWLILGIIAIVAAFINLYMYKTGKDYKIAMTIGFSFTALILCVEYTVVYKWVEGKNWYALLDVVPTMEISLWVLMIISILLNITPIF